MKRFCSKSSTVYFTNMFVREWSPKTGEKCKQRLINYWNIRMMTTYTKPLLKSHWEQIILSSKLFCWAQLLVQWLQLCMLFFRFCDCCVFSKTSVSLNICSIKLLISNYNKIWSQWKLSNLNQSLGFKFVFHDISHFILYSFLLLE